MSKLYRIFVWLVVGGLVCVACAAPSSAAQPSASQSQPQSTPAAPTAAPPIRPAVVTPDETAAFPSPTAASATSAAAKPPAASLTPAPTRRPAIDPADWQSMPVVPEVSDTARAIFDIGQRLGNHPNVFSKIGDCGSTPAWFLGDFDRGPEFYDLGRYGQLQPVIDAFSGSFGRTSLAARSGFNASALWVPLWADRAFCNSNESPLACEYRVHRPAIAFIMLGTNDVWKPAEFEPQMRKIIEYSIGNGVIPILSTKADNQEGDHAINAAIARLAVEYDIPLWNYWAAVQALPNGGLQEDGAHLTWGRNFFDDPEDMQKAWPVRNLTALQVLNAVWQKIK